MEESTDALLQSAAATLPPEILRIIASKYRRAYEIKTCPCPEAITMQPIEVHVYQSYLRIIDRIDIYCFPDQYFYNVCTGYNNSILVNVGKEKVKYLGAHNPTYMTSPVLTLIWIENLKYVECFLQPGLNIYTLIRALILLKRNEIPIEGNTSIYLYFFDKNKHCFERSNSTLRKLLYQNLFLINGILNPIKFVARGAPQKTWINLCSIM